MLLSAYVLFVPTPAGPQPFPQADKVVHLVLFALLAATARWRFGSRGRVLGLVAGYAVVSELVQWQLLAARSGDLRDVAADLAGAGLGWWLAGRLARSAKAG